MNPYESPSAELDFEVGELDVAIAVYDGIGAAARNWYRFIAVGVIALIAYYASICTCIGWIVVLPLLMFGGYSFLVEAEAGEASIGTLFRGVGEHFGTAFLSMWGLMLCYIPITVPLIIAIATVMFWDGLPEPGEQQTTWTQVAALQAIGFVWGLAIVRLMLAPFFIVDQGHGALEAFSASWEVTEGNWLGLAALQILLLLLNTPSTVITNGWNIYMQALPPSQQIEVMATGMALILGSLLFQMIAGVLGLTFFASAYSQLARRGSHSPDATA